MLHDNLFQAVSQSGNTRYISTNPGGCAWNQTSTSRTGNADSVLITMTAYGKFFIGMSMSI